MSSSSQGDHGFSKHWPKLSKNRVLVIGVDAALANMGLAKVEVDVAELRIVKVHDLKLVETAPDPSKQVRVSADRLRRGREILQELRAFSYGATISCAEVPSGAQSANAAFSFGMTLGILCASPLPLVEVSQQEVKKCAVGKLSASKDEMMQWAFNLAPDAPWLTTNGGRRINKNEHLADAVAAVHAGLRTQIFKALSGHTAFLTSKPQPTKRRRLELP